MAIDLSGRVALITGVAAGIGRATALRLAALGAVVTGCDRDAAALEELRAELPDATLGVLDVREHVRVQRFVAQVIEVQGRLDIVVNNAAGTYAAPFVDSVAKGDESLIRENLLSAAWVIRAAAPHLGPGASIVNVSSIEARRAAPEFAIYAAAKAGMESLTRTLALELGAQGIRVNTVAPDVIRTPGVGDLPDATTPLGRVGEPEEVANVIAFLASPLASFVNGATIAVDGGNLAAGGWRRGPDGWQT